MNEHQVECLFHEIAATNDLLRQAVELLKAIERKTGPSDNPFSTYGNIGYAPGDGKRG